MPFLSRVCSKSNVYLSTQISVDSTYMGMKVLPTQPTPFSNSRLGESQFHFLITRMITDRIGLHSVLLPINKNFNRIFDTIGYVLKQNTRNSKFVLLTVKKKKPFKRARDGAYCPIT